MPRSGAQGSNPAVIPAQAGIQSGACRAHRLLRSFWIPACAGMMAGFEPCAPGLTTFTDQADTALAPGVRRLRNELAFGSLQFVGRLCIRLGNRNRLVGSFKPEILALALRPGAGLGGGFLGPLRVAGNWRFRRLGHGRTPSGNEMTAFLARQRQAVDRWRADHAATSFDRERPAAWQFTNSKARPFAMHGLIVHGDQHT